MSFTEEELYKNYSLTNPVSYGHLLRSIEITKELVEHSFESFVVGQAVTKLFTNEENNVFKIITMASNDDLNQIIPGLKVGNNEHLYLKEDDAFYYFEAFNTRLLNSSSNVAEYYNKKLSISLLNEVFNIRMLAISPSKQITDIYRGSQAIARRTIDTVESAVEIFDRKPELMVEVLALASEYGFTLSKQIIKAIQVKGHLLTDVSEITSIRRMKAIIKSNNCIPVLKMIYSNKLFEDQPIYNFVSKMIVRGKKLNTLEGTALLYLIIGKIPDATFMDQDFLKDIVDTITFTQLLISDKVTPMMVYNVGLEMLLSADRIAVVYNEDYESQAKNILKLQKKLVIKNIHELNFTQLELINLLNGERSIRVKIIMNIILERVINGVIPNYTTYIKEEAIKIIDELHATFNYEEPENELKYSEDDIKLLLEKYKKDLEFLVKVYLNDEAALYSLTAHERDEAKANAARHAKEFLLETSQYKILETRGLI